MCRVRREQCVRSIGIYDVFVRPTEADFEIFDLVAEDFFADELIKISSWFQAITSTPLSCIRIVKNSLQRSH